jgi:hypothetical protein
MQADLATAQAHGDTQLAARIQGLIQQSQAQPSASPVQLQSEDAPAPAQGTPYVTAGGVYWPNGAPESASPTQSTPPLAEMQADLKTAQAHGDTQLAQRIQSMIQQAQAPQQSSDGQIAGEPDLGAAGNSVLAGGVHFVHELPLVGDAAITAGRWANDQLNGRNTSWQQANAEAHQTIASAQQQHPIASTVGGIAGGVDAAAVGGGLLKAAGGGEAVLSALPKATTLAGRAANVGRVAAAGALAGGAQGAAQGAGEQLAAGDFAAAPGAAGNGALVGGATGAVLGPVVGGAAASAAKVTLPLAGKTAQALARVFGEDPADLQAAWQTFVDNTGRVPSMAELATLKQSGEIAGAARDSSTITASLRQAADDAARVRSDTMQQAFAPQPGPASSGEFANAKTTQGDVDYPAARQFNFAIPTEESGALGGVSPADHLAAAVVPQAGLGKADRVRILSDLQNGNLSGQDAQLIRANLARAQGTGSNYSPAISSAQADLEDILSSPGNEDARAALATADQNYTAGAQRQAGAAHGETVLGSQTAPNFAAEAASKPNANTNFTSGMASGASSKLADAAATPQGATALARRLATDDSLNAKLATTFGQGTADAFRRLGQSETQAADNFAPYARRTPQADDQDAKDAKTVFQGLAAVATHGGVQIYHAAKALTGLGMSPQVKEKVAQYLSDPKMAQQGINLLRKAGASNAQLRQLAIGAALRVGALGGAAANTVTEKQP